MSRDPGLLREAPQRQQKRCGVGRAVLQARSSPPPAPVCAQPCVFLHSRSRRTRTDQSSRGSPALTEKFVRTEKQLTGEPERNFHPPNHTRPEAGKLETEPRRRGRLQRPTCELPSAAATRRVRSKSCAHIRGQGSFKAAAEANCVRGVRSGANGPPRPRRHAGSAAEREWLGERKVCRDSPV